MSIAEKLYEDLVKTDYDPRRARAIADAFAQMEERCRAAYQEKGSRSSFASEIEPDPHVAKLRTNPSIFRETGQYASLPPTGEGQDGGDENHSTI